ncbi:hypothetical protein O181_065284 [Austropuccinia psidii MF-1]|uniref:Uncharacterized protein n=1 Tax=Austropuccinia psidii MF-1 TaxID=1389203 RepID=A0A9Q3EQS1_9BASI|nr:hypothetical protein [Austropuccinia psidii MF-1]
MSPEKTEELLRGWTPMSCKGQVQQIKAWLKNQSMLSEDQKKKLAQGKDNTPVEAPQVSKSKTLPPKVPNKDKKTPKTNRRERQNPSGRSLTHRITDFPKKRRKPLTMCSIQQEI